MINLRKKTGLLIFFLFLFIGLSSCESVHNNTSFSINITAKDNDITKIIPASNITNVSSVRIQDNLEDPPQTVISCNVCPSAGAKKCIDDNSYRVCGLFNNDNPCLNLSTSVYYCPLGYLCQDGECVVNMNEIKCEKLSVNNEGDNKINILFVPDNISQSELNSFRNRLMLHVDSFYQTEPFKSNKELLNFYFLSTTQPFFENGQIDYGDYLRERLSRLSSTCNYDISQFIIVTKEHIETPATLGEGIASTPIIDPWTTLHEFAHSFAGLDDTYHPTINHQGTGLIDVRRDAPNIDDAGCSKWCDGTTGVYETECTKITNEDECKRHERIKNEWGLGCINPEKCCVWLNSPDPFFNSQCVNGRGHINIGNGCMEQTGCYYGISHAWGKWRPNDDFDTNSYMGIIGGDVSQPWSYDPVSIKTINLKIQCCYTQKNNNYPMECKSYSEKYNAFSGCN